MDRPDRQQPERRDLALELLERLAPWLVLAIVVAAVVLLLLLRVARLRGG